MNTLESLLRMKVEMDGMEGRVQVTPDFRVAVQGEVNGGIHIIIHPLGHNGETLDFVVTGNLLKPIGSETGQEAA